MEPGEYFLGDEEIEINAGCRTVKIEVRNTGDRAVQVGSHYHFFEVNRALEFDRAAAMGMRLNIIAGTTLRFEPGDTREVELVEYTGRRRAVGFNGLVNGSATSAAQVRPALERAWLLGFKGSRAPEARDDEPRERTPRERTSRERTPREETPRERTPREETPREKTPRGKTPRDGKRGGR